MWGCRVSCAVGKDLPSFLGGLDQAQLLSLCFPHLPAADAQEEFDSVWAAFHPLNLGIPFSSPSC